MFERAHSGTLNFVKFHISFVFTYLKNFIGLPLKIKKFKFWRAVWGGTPIVAPSISGGYQYFSISIIAHNMIHVRFVVSKKIVIEEKKIKKIRKNFIQGEINEYDHDKGRK